MKTTKRKLSDENDILILNLIKSRLRLIDISQSRLASIIGTSPTQLGLFLQRKGSLPKKSFIELLKIIGIDFFMYRKRTEFAKEIANYLVLKGITNIDNWTKEQLAQFTKKKTILFLIDVKSVEEYKELMSSDIIDMESTYPYFMALVSYYMIYYMDFENESSIRKLLDNLKNNYRLPGIIQPGTIQLFSREPINSLHEKAIDYITFMYMYENKSQY